MWHAYLSTLYNFYDTYITFMKRKNKHEKYRNISVFCFCSLFQANIATVFLKEEI